MWSTPSLSSFPGPLWLGVVALDRVLSMGQIYGLNHFWMTLFFNSLYTVAFLFIIHSIYIYIYIYICSYSVWLNLSHLVGLW